MLLSVLPGLTGCSQGTRDGEGATEQVPTPEDITTPARPSEEQGPPASPQTEAAQAELGWLKKRVPEFEVLVLPQTGELTLKREQGLTIEDLREKDLDEDPPALKKRSFQYHKNQMVDCPPYNRVYEAKGIRPFRFKHFNCEFNYGGWHNFEMQDYAATHGFNIIYPYIRSYEETKHWPDGTGILQWGGFVNWHKWLPEHGLPEGRYDLLSGMDLVKMHIDEGRFKRDREAKDAKGHADYYMIDQEHPVLSPAKLREQDWYPKDAPEDERAAFEKKYYDGYAQTYISSVDAARACGWERISIYGWYPYGRTWGGLEKTEAEPGTDQAWNAFGKPILEHVDIVNNSVYCFYWSPQNVAYVLANIDMNVKMVNSAETPKPVRPYFWTLLHGGGGGWRWWREQPLASEETRAMTAMSFFTGMEGFDIWNWSGTGSHHRVDLRTKVKRIVETDGAKKTIHAWQLNDAMIGKPFTAKSADGMAESFKRYDAVHVVSYDEATRAVRFQKIRPGKKNHGATDDQPSFLMPAEDLKACLRCKSEPVAAMIEGMALVKPLEYILRHGEVKIDVPAQEQFGRTLPIVRRVKLGRWHILITYDPKVIFGGTPREIVLEDFDGAKGRTLRLPSDAETRVFVLEE